MIKSIILSVLFINSLAILCDAKGQSLDNETAKAQFVEFSKMANDEYRKSLATVALDYTSTRQVNSNTSVSSATVFSKAPLELIKEKNDGDEFSTVFMINPEYSANLRNVGGEFSLDNIRSLVETNPYAGRVGLGDRFCCQFGQFGDYNNDKHISELLQSGELVINAAKQNQDDTLTIDFTWDAQPAAKLTGQLTVNPKRFWTIDRLETNGIANGRNTSFKLIARYDHEVINGVIPPSYHEESTTYVDNSVVDHKVNDYKFYLPNPMPSDEEFRVSHYGIPEPDWASKPSKSYLWLWLIIGAVVIAGIGFAIRNTARQS